MKFNYIVLFVALFFAVKTNAQSSVLALPDSADVYSLLKSNEVEKLKKLIYEPQNKEFLLKFDAAFGTSFDAKKQYENLQTKNVDDWEIELFEQRYKQLQFVEEYKKNTAISEELHGLVQKSIRWNYWHLLLAYPILRSNKDTKLKYVTSLPRVMTDELLLEEVQQPNDLVLDSYRKFLPFFVTYFNSEANKFVKYADRVKAATDKTFFAQKHLRDVVFDYTQTQIVLEQCSFLTATSARFLISQIYDEDLQTYVKEHCKEALNRKEEVAKKEEKPKKESNLPKILDLEDKTFDFSDFKGKVIYVDFWASWCGPCRKEMPFSRKMHEGLTEKQKKEIVFLYISIDEEIDNWKKAVQELGLKDAGVNGHSYEMAGRYKVSSIPRYMIINKNGEVVNDNAPRPSSPETLEKLIELMGK